MLLHEVDEIQQEFSKIQKPGTLSFSPDVTLSKYIIYSRMIYC